MTEITAKNLNPGDKSWTFLDGSKRTVVILETAVIGRGTYSPGWKWSEHVGKQTGKTSERHIGLIESGRMVVKGVDGVEVEIGPGDAFELKAGSDAWVVGDEPCVALDFESLKKN